MWLSPSEALAAGSMSVPSASWFFSDPEQARDVHLTADVAGAQKASTIHSANTALTHTTAH